MSNTSIHLLGLNGLRAIAALSVLWRHCMQSTFGNWGIPEYHFPFLSDGVTMFFVISGFLITYLLLEEQKQVGRISIPKFYMRRILRIWPIYYGYLAIVIVTLALFGRLPEIINSTLLYYVFFAANIPFALHIGLWPIVHYWSIGVEEQFYLFWPWIVKFLGRNILKIALYVCVGWLSLKYVSLFLWGHESFLYRFVSVTRFDCMMLGAMGAILYSNKNHFFLKWMTNKWIDLVAWLLLLLSGIYASIIPAPIRIQYIAVLSLIVIMSQVGTKKFIINLENRFFDFIGKISYGIYVIHPILIFVCSIGYSKLNINLSIPLQYLIIYLGMTLLTISLAYLSYTYFEKPFLKLKERFSIVHSKNDMK